MRYRYIGMATFLAVFVTNARADHQSWYEQQELNPETQVRLAVSWKSCCNNSEVVRPRFRVNRTTYEDEWYWLDGNTWRRIPSDTVHYNETPDGKPLMFVYQGNVTCFYTGDTGG